MQKHHEPAGDWPMGNLLWFAVMIWFCSSLLSQSAFIAINGLPYDAITMLKSLGPIYYLIIVLELMLWAGILGIGGYKMFTSAKTVVSD